MRASLLPLLSALALLAGCSAEESAHQPTSDQAVQAVDTAPAATRAADAPTAIAVNLPQLAYVYALAFTLPGERVAALQDAHLALCEQMGPARCQLIGLQRGSGDGARSEASLKLRVATADARRFDQALNRAATDAGGRALDTQVTAEDVSKAMVDAQARIDQRTLLVERLTQLLRTRQGKVAELVEAERRVAEAQEELDQARGWLNTLRGRVALSSFDIRYQAIAPVASAGSVVAGIAEAVVGSGATFLLGMHGLITLAIYLLPWAAIFALGVWVARRLRPARAQDQG